MADLSFAMTFAQHCQGGKLAVTVPAEAQPPRVERRLERSVSHHRIDPDTIWSQMARSLLGDWAGGPIVLILGQPPHHNELRARKLTVASRQRARPLCCVGYTLGGQPEPMPELVVSLLPQVAACLPEGAEVTLLADRGLAASRRYLP